MPEKTALDVFGRAAAAGWGSVDVLTNSVFREPCTFYFSREALRAVDAAFVLDLMTVIRGQDKKGQDFEMTALLAGRGKLVVLYDRDGIVYRNERLARDFKLASRVEFETPAAGVLENVQGLCAKVLLLGCVRVRSLVKVGKTLEVQAGTFTSETPLKPIHAGRAGPVTPKATRAGRLPAPATSGAMPRFFRLLSVTRTPKRYRHGTRQSRRSRNVPIEVRAEMTGGLFPRWRMWFRSRVTSHSSAPTHSATLAWPYGSECRPQYGQAV